METPETSAGTSAPRQTLAMRMAERSRLRAERAERLARLVPVRGERAPQAAGPSADRAEPAAPAPVRFASPERDPERDDAAALEEFLRSLTRGLDGRQPSAQPALQPAAGEVLPFQRPAQPEAGGSAADPDPHCDLGRLAGVGPGLAWALRRAGIPDLASVAALEPEALAARLGPLGRLVPARAWVEAARTLGA